MAMRQQNSTVVGVFDDHSVARAAIRDLKAAGFREDQIGVASSSRSDARLSDDDTDAGDDDNYAGEGALAGAATGAGIGALWGLGIVAGVLPAIGPVIAGGALAALLASAAAGAAAAGLAGALIGMGMSKEEAEYYESELKSGRTIVTVTAESRASEARSILSRHGGYDMSTRASSTESSASRTGALPGSPMPATAGNTANERRTDSTLAGDACHTGAGTTSHAAGSTIQAHEERLRVQKTPIEGEVRVRKEVHTEHKQIDVPVTREEVVIERHAGSGREVSSSDLKPGQEIRVPVKQEEVNVEKQAVVAEEVTVGKRKVQDTERVDETLRKENIKVETRGDVRVDDQRNKGKQ